MSYLVAGKMKVEGTNKTTGNAYSGTNIYLLETIKSDFGEGMKVVVKNTSQGKNEKLYVPGDVIAYSDIPVNKKCEVLFDQYGNIKGIQF